MTSPNSTGSPLFRFSSPIVKSTEADVLPPSSVSSKQEVVHIISFFLFFFFFFCLFSFVFLGLYPQHMNVPRLGVDSELQLLVYTTAIAMPESEMCLRSVPELTEQGQGSEPSSSWILVGFVNHWATMGTPILLISKACVFFKSQIQNAIGSKKYHICNFGFIILNLTLYLGFIHLVSWFFFFFLFFFLGPYPWHMEIPRLGSN